jgi:hypothetical protein
MTFMESGHPRLSADGVSNAERVLLEALPESWPEFVPDASVVIHVPDRIPPPVDIVRAIAPVPMKRLAYAPRHVPSNNTDGLVGESQPMLNTTSIMRVARMPRAMGRLPGAGVPAEEGAGPWQLGTHGAMMRA